MFVLVYYLLFSRLILYVKIVLQMFVLVCYLLF